MQRVKIYKGSDGIPKGDALVVFQKEASVYGAYRRAEGAGLALAGPSWHGAT